MEYSGVFGTTSGKGKWVVVGMAGRRGNRGGGGGGVWGGGLMGKCEARA